MSMTDGFDVNDSDRRQGSLDPEREAAATSSGANSDSQAIGRVVQISPKLVGCGCFGCSSVVFLAGCVALLGIVWGFLLPIWRVNNRYIPMTGLVLDKRLDSQMFQVADPDGRGGRQAESYRPEIKVRYEVNGRKFEVWSYDATGIYSPDRAAQQAIVDSFQVGSTYPCWYDPDRPDRAVLVRGNTLGASLFLILPIGLLIVGGVGLLIAWKLSTAQPIRATSGGFPPKPPTIPGWIQTLLPGRDPRPGFDPSQFGDPVAMKADWTPAKAGGVSFRTRRLVEVDPDRLEFRASMEWLLIVLLLLLGGMGMFIAYAAYLLSSGGVSFSTLPQLLMSLLCALPGGVLLYFSSIPIVFDKRNGFYWRGRRAPDEVYDGYALRNAAALREIHALQILSEYIGGETSYTSYELNLVLRDGERINVIDQAGRDKLRRDAATLADFLGVPVWDAT